MWHHFDIVTYLSVALWLLGGSLIYSKNKALRVASIAAHLGATLMEELRASAIAHFSRNTHMVLALYGAHRLRYLLALSTKMDA